MGACPRFDVYSLLDIPIQETDLESVISIQSQHLNLLECPVFILQVVLGGA